MRHKRHPGQGLVEFGLIAPILLLILFIIIEGGRLMLAYTAVYSASRDAARYGSAVGENSFGELRYLDCDGIRTVALRLAGLTPIDESDVGIQYDHGPGTEVFAPSCPPGGSITPGDRIIVSVTSTFRFIAPIAGVTSIPIASEARRTVYIPVEIE